MGRDSGRFWTKVSLSLNVYRINGAKCLLFFSDIKLRHYFFNLISAGDYMFSIFLLIKLLKASPFNMPFDSSAKSINCRMFLFSLA